MTYAIHPTTESDLSSSHPATAADRLGREQLAAQQIECLRETVAWAFERVPWYHQHYDIRGHLAG